MTTQSKPSRFKSRFKSFQAIVRGKRDVYHPVTGVKIDELKPLVAEFGIHRGEYRVADPVTGQESVFADIAGHYYDLDDDAEAKGWTEEEKESVRARLMTLSKQWPEAVQVYETPRAAAPWPTYDTTHHSKVAALAVELGLVGEAIQYERENKARPSVLAELEKHVAQEAEQVEELTAA